VWSASGVMVDVSVNSSLGDSMEDSEKLHMRPNTLPRDKAQLCRTSWLEHFYEILWSCSLDLKGVRLPFTVCFQYQRPYAAYYTDSTGALTKVEAKHIDTGPRPTGGGDAHKLRMTNVLQKILPEDTEKGENKCAGIYMFSRDHLSKGDRDLGIEYLNASQLHTFCLFRAKVHNGLLQAAVDQGAAKISSIRAYWTPHVCKFETKVNEHSSLSPADVKNFSLARRSCTFDGLENDAVSQPVNERIKARLVKVINRMAAGVIRIIPSGLTIQVMVLHFKTCAKGHLWFMYCSSLRLIEEEKQVGRGIGQANTIEKAIKKRILSMSEHRPNTAHVQQPELPPAKGKGAKERRGRVCVVTGTVFAGALDRYHASRRELITHFCWHGVSEGYLLAGNTKEAISAYEEEHAAAVTLQSTAEKLSKSLRKLLTSTASKGGGAGSKAEKMVHAKGRTAERERQENAAGLIFLDDYGAFDAMLGSDTELKHSFSILEKAMLRLIAAERDPTSEETFLELCMNGTFLEQESTVCEEVKLALSATQTEMLTKFDPVKRNSGAPSIASRKPLRSEQVRSELAVRAPINARPKLKSSLRQNRSHSAPPGAHETDETGKETFVLMPYSENDKKVMAEDIMSRGFEYFGSVKSGTWHPPPPPDGRRWIKGEVHAGECEFWFNIFSGMGPKGKPSRMNIEGFLALLESAKMYPILLARCVLCLRCGVFHD